MLVYQRVLLKLFGWRFFPTQISINWISNSMDTPLPGPASYPVRPIPWRKEVDTNSVCGRSGTRSEPVGGGWLFDAWKNIIPFVSQGLLGSLPFISLLVSPGIGGLTITMAISQLASHGDDPSDDSNDIQRPSQECSNTDLNGAAWVSQ